VLSLMQDITNMKEEQAIKIAMERQFDLPPKVCVTPVRLRAFGKMRPSLLAVVLNGR